MRLSALALAASFAALAVPQPVSATAQRTFVASTGSDSNPCSVTAPCRSFGAAILQTNPVGEIVVLDSAGYGRVTIGKSVTIVAPEGVYAGISVFSGFNGVDVLTPGLSVALKGLSINGQGGLHGIYMNAASDLAVERCEIANMAGDGLFVETAGAKVSVQDSSARGNGNGGFAFTGASRATLARVHAEGNQYAGVGVYDGAAVVVRDSTLVKNVKGVEAMSVTAIAPHTSVQIDGATIADNTAQGLYADVAFVNLVELMVSHSSIAHNVSGGALVQSSSTGAFVAGVFSANAFEDDSATTGVQVKCVASPCDAWVYLMGNRFGGTGNSTARVGVGALTLSSGDNSGREGSLVPSGTIAGW